ncbi:hypothetical protein N7474_007651 [Penicillium riverlandense]|uniref:uncharacterized protein n=1 Tax=Penicillium riverlandense TaxID=1903569 RepID=UPI0025496FEA|nr:uncharacterized protein N7474_007651 [Penicillium riverlandense]KAJ5811350.1 hypothetical protein N7474_007651 [Penicillium riverlandense]
MRRHCLFRGVLLAVAIIPTVVYLLLPQGIPALDAVLGKFISVRRVDVFDFHDTKDEERCLNLNRGIVSTDAIPKVVHVIWLNPELTFINYLTVRSALISIMPDRLLFHYTTLNETNEWFRKLHGNITLVRHDLAQEYPRQIRENWNIAHVADALRLDIIQQSGGIYFDMDMIVLRSFDNILQSDRDMVLGNEGGDRRGLCNGVIIGRKNSSFIKRWIDSYSSFSPKEWNYHSVVYPKLLSLWYPQEICALSPVAFFWPTWTKRHVQYMYEPITEQEAEDLQHTLAINEGSLYPNQLAYHAWSHSARVYLESLTPEIVKTRNTRFNVLVRRFVD